MQIFTDHQSQEQFSIMKEILNHALQKNKLVLIKGGWNIDLAYGKQTRKHDDIDFHYELKDKDFWKEFFIKNEYTIDEKNEHYFVAAKKEVVIDFGGFTLQGKDLVWGHGRTSKQIDVYEEVTIDGMTFNRMKLGVERYLKQKKAADNHIELRQKDVHDLKLLKELLK